MTWPFQNIPFADIIYTFWKLASKNVFNVYIIAQHIFIFVSRIWITTKASLLKKHGMLKYSLLNFPSKCMFQKQIFLLSCITGLNHTLIAVIKNMIFHFYYCSNSSLPCYCFLLLNIWLITLLFLSYCSISNFASIFFPYDFKHSVTIKWI